MPRASKRTRSSCRKEEEEAAAAAAAAAGATVAEAAVAAATVAEVVRAPTPPPSPPTDKVRPGHYNVYCVDPTALGQGEIDEEHFSYPGLPKKYHLLTVPGPATVESDPLRVKVVDNAPILAVGPSEMLVVQILADCYQGDELADKAGTMHALCGPLIYMPPPFVRIVETRKPISESSRPGLKVYVARTGDDGKEDIFLKPTNEILGLEERLVERPAEPWETSPRKPFEPPILELQPGTICLVVPKKRTRDKIAEVSSGPSTFAFPYRYSPFVFTRHFMQPDGRLALETTPWLFIGVQSHFVQASITSVTIPKKRFEITMEVLAKCDCSPMTSENLNLLKEVGPESDYFSPARHAILGFFRELDSTLSDHLIAGGSASVVEGMVIKKLEGKSFGPLQVTVVGLGRVSITPLSPPDKQ